PAPGRAPRARSGGCPRPPVAVPVGHHHGPGTLGGEALGQCPADAARAAGHHADAVLELHGPASYGRRRGYPAIAARTVASAEARRSAPPGSGISTGESTPASV